MLIVYSVGLSGAAVPELSCFPQTHTVLGGSLFFLLAMVVLVI